MSRRLPPPEPGPLARTPPLPGQPPQSGLAHVFLRRIRPSGFLLPAALSVSLLVKGLHPQLPGLPCPLRALTGIPCPTCFLTRATAAALSGDLRGAIQLHAFGPLAAAGLLAWSLLAIRQRRLLPRGLPAWPVALAVAGLILYWLLRLWLSFGLGWNGFPAFPALP